MHNDHFGRVVMSNLSCRCYAAHVQSYLKSGNASLGKYDDKSYSLTLAEELRPLLKPASFMYGYSPDFQKYLENFPQGRPENAAILEDFLYWSKEDFGLKPVTSVTHVTIYKRSLGNESDVIVGSKGIYGSHYFDSSLGLTAFVQSQASEPPRSYLIYVNRSRTDALRGFFGGWKRSLISGRVRDGAKKSMAARRQWAISWTRSFLLRSANAVSRRWLLR